MISVENNRTSLLDAARNEIITHIDPEVNRVLDNIADIHCDPDKKRSITLRLDFIPLGGGVFKLKISSKSTLASAPATACIMQADRLPGRGPWRIENMDADALPGQLAVGGIGQEEEDEHENSQD